MYNQTRTTRPDRYVFDKSLPDFQDNKTDYFSQATLAISAISNDLNASWEKSDNGASKVREWGGAVILRGSADKGIPLAVNIKKGKRAHSKPRTRGGDIKSTDSLIGIFHTHPYSEKDIERVTGAYNWDGQGAPPSGGDLIALALDPDSSNGQFSVIESGNVRYLTILTDLALYKSVVAPQNSVGGTFSDYTEKRINDEVSKERDQNKNNMEKNKNAETPMTYVEAWLKGLIIGLNALVAENGVSNLGVQIYKTTDTEKIVFKKIFG